MVREGKAATKNGGKGTAQEPPQPKSIAVAERGIRTGADFAGFMSYLIGDVVTRRVTPEVANAACNAGGKMLKAVEMQWKYARPQQDGADSGALLLAPGVGSA